MKLVWKLLRENISKPQFVGFFLANLIGMSIVLLAIQFYFDINPIFSGDETLFKKDYITITKQVGLMSAISSEGSGFSPEEIEDIKKQNFVMRVGGFTPSQYSVLAGIENQNAGISFKTEMFFESLPDEFIDVKLTDWGFTPTDTEIPIVLPKNYLDLYNFGFAEANSLPKLSEGLIGMVGLDIVLYGKNGVRKQMNGRIVGFSNRINTILVPSSFMDWANSSFGGSVSSNPARLMVEVDNIADPNLANYFKEKGYEISGDNNTASKMSFFLKVIVSVVILVGGIICILSFFILVLSVYLLLEKNIYKLRTLRLIGYSKSLVVRPYEILILGLNTIILVLSFAVLLICRTQYLNAVGKIYPVSDTNFPSTTLVIGFSIFLFVSVLNVAIIRSKVK